MAIFSTLIDAVDEVVAAHINDLQTQVGASGQMPLCEGRLTLSSGTPVTTSDQTAKTTVYFTPFRGNRVSIYDSGEGGWLPYTLTEKSVSVPSTTTTPFDVFAYISGGAITLQALDWTNDTTRATALTTQDGIYVKNGATGYRYLGTGRTTGVNGQTAVSEADCLLWNYYNRVPRYLKRTYSNSHTYNTATYRAFDNAQTSIQATCVVGVVEDAMGITSGQQIIYAAGNSTPIAGLGVNVTNSTTLSGILQIITGTQWVWTHGHAFPQAGYNYLCPVEYSDAGGTAPTFNGSLVFATIYA